MNRDILYFKSIVIIFLFILSILLITIGDSVWSGIIALGVLVVSAWVFSEFELIHPLTWFPPIFFLYSVSYPLLISLGELSNTYNQNSEILFIQWLALFTFIIIINTSGNEKIEVDISLLKNLMPIVIPIFWISIFLTSIYVFYVYSSGLTSKYAINLDNSSLGVFTPLFSIIVISFALIVANRIGVKGKLPKGFIFVAMSYGAVVLLVLGERDFILKLFIVTVFLYHILKNKISKKKMILLGLAVIFIIPILGNLKNSAFNQGMKNINENNFIINTLNGEFMTVGRNLSNLLSSENIAWSYYFGETLWWDIKVLFSTGVSPGAWFNDRFYPDLVARGGGNGFSLVGEGYINFGMLGVMIFFAMLAVFLKILYKNAKKNVVWLTIYIVTIPLTVYVIRADFATLITQFSKQILLPIIIIFAIKIILEGRGNFNKFITLKENRF